MARIGMLALRASRRRYSFATAMGAAVSTENTTNTALACRLCGDWADLRYPSGEAWVENGALAPTSHEVGAHGDLYVCRRCGTVQSAPLPSSELLTARYVETQDDRYLEEERGRRRTARRLLDLLDRRVRAGRMLDIGCGHGLLMAEARERGWEPTGLELSCSAVAHARSLGLQVHERGIENADLPAGSFHAVVAVDLIEHLHEPREFVRRCSELLAPGGALMIATPDPESWLARGFGRRWWGYIPAHLHLLPRRILRELLQAEGLLLADDVAMIRDFSLGYWLSGLAGRGGLIGRRLGAFTGLPIPDRPIALGLGDERVMLATRVEASRAQSPLASRTQQQPRVDVVLPAYQAARTLPEVARQLPGESINRALVVDDASCDRTAAVALEHGLDVLVHPANRGYGANQKTCYVAALRDGADVVVMVHADNQYDPRLVPEMIQPILDSEADVVIGSRLLNDRAIVGGMPRWKWLGNKFLTTVENCAFRQTYSEYHTGYRAFSADFLRSVAFLRNSDTFVFDQEIFAQAVARGARVREIAIPTRYFLEASSVSFGESVRYGCRTLIVLARFGAHNANVWRWPLLQAPAFELDSGSAT